MQLLELRALRLAKYTSSQEESVTLSCDELFQPSMDWLLIIAGSLFEWKRSRGSLRMWRNLPKMINAYLHFSWGTGPNLLVKNETEKSRKRVHIVTLCICPHICPKDRISKYPFLLDSKSIILLKSTLSEKHTHRSSSFWYVCFLKTISN